MDIQPQTQQPISDDQELAKVLAGVSRQANAAVPSINDDLASMQPDPIDQPQVASIPPSMPDPTSMSAPAATAVPPIANNDLESIKKDALSELRPLVDKLDVPPEEKFDTYLLLLRSTDDQALIAPAHEAARMITDEARRAQALLDVIKEIDYLSNPHQ